MELLNLFTLKKSKKGVSVLLMAIEIIAALMVCYLLFDISTTYAKEEKTLQIKTTKDIALLTNTLVSLPGNAILPYPRDTSEQTIQIKNNKVIVYKDITEKTQYPFVSIFGAEIDTESTNIQHLYLKKMGKVITLTEDISFDHYLVPLTSALTSNQNWQDNKITIIPETIGENTNFIGKLIVGNINAKTGKTTAELRNLNNIPSSNMIIEFIKTGEQNTLNAYVATKEEFIPQNKKLASLIINELVKYDTKSIIANNKIILEDKRHSLTQSNTAVVIEYGNDVESNLASKLPNAIQAAIERYYN